VITKDRSDYMPYLMKLTKFYLPSLLGNISHIIIGAILYAGILAFFGNYRLKLS